MKRNKIIAISEANSMQPYRITIGEYIWGHPKNTKVASIELDSIQVNSDSIITIVACIDIDGNVIADFIRSSVNVYYE